MSKYFADIRNAKNKVVQKLESDDESQLNEQLNELIKSYDLYSHTVELYEVDENGVEINRIVWKCDLINLRNYADTIRSAVERENQNDPNWSWSVRSISKDTVKIRWGYLKEINGDNDSFVLRLKTDYVVDFNEAVYQVLEALNPDNIGGVIVADIVTDIVPDENDVTCVETHIEKALDRIIHKVAVCARNCY